MTAPLRPLPAGAPAARRRLPVVNIVLVLAGLLAVNLLVAAVVIGGRDEGPALPSNIEAVIPEPGSGMLAQDAVGADLIDTYTGVLRIDGVEIPEDQLQIVRSLGEVGFRPGPDKDIARFAEGIHSATIVYWPQDRTREEAAKSFTWSFRVH